MIRLNTVAKYCDETKPKSSAIWLTELSEVRKSRLAASILVRRMNCLGVAPVSILNCRLKCESDR